MKRVICIGVVMLLGGCASSPVPKVENQDTGSRTAAKSSQADTGKTSAQSPPASGKYGDVDVTLVNLAGDTLPGKLELMRDAGGVAAVISVTNGHGTGQAPVGTYQGYLYGFDEDVPVLVAIQPVTVKQGTRAHVSIELTESSGKLTLLNFDQDYDFVLDRLEEEQGTNPHDPTSYPGAIPVSIPENIIKAEAAWYGGDLHVHSNYDPYGTESVAELVRRAEDAGLNFLAIADRNSLAACTDPGFTSSQLALIPAMEWGNDDEGVALIYGPRTVPQPPADFGTAQAMVVRLQAQGAFVSIAHPCFPMMPWQWNLSYMSGIEVWAREFSAVPPAVPEDLKPEMLVRADGKLLNTLARAVATKNLSANGQASVYYDLELVRQLKASAIAGSMSGSPKVPIGHPVTYVYAQNLSAPAVLEGLVKGRTFVTSGLDGPLVFLRADVMADGTIDVPMVGGSVPVGVPVKFEVIVVNGRGKKMQLLRNGIPERSQWVEDDNYIWSCIREPDSYSDYRVRIVDTVNDHTTQYGHLRVLAMTSPIYAENILADIIGPNADPNQFRIRIKNYFDEYNRVQKILPSNPSPYELQFNRINRGR